MQKSTETAALGELPAWDLSDLYPARDSKSLYDDLDRLDRDAAAFRARYMGRIAALEGEALGVAVAAYEALD